MKNIDLNTWHVKVEEYLVTYVITKKQNVSYEGELFYEFGIECFLHKGDEQIAYESVDCISPDYDKVFRMLQTLKRFQVFPAHLKEVICDLLECDEEETVHLLSA